MPSYLTAVMKISSQKPEENQKHKTFKGNNADKFRHAPGKGKAVRNNNRANKASDNKPAKRIAGTLSLNK